MDGLEVKRSSKKKRLWPSARRKKTGPRRGKENECPNNRSNTTIFCALNTTRSNGAILSEPDVMYQIGSAADYDDQRRRQTVGYSHATIDTGDSRAGTPVVVVEIHQPPSPGRSKTTDIRELLENKSNEMINPLPAHLNLSRSITRGVVEQMEEEPNETLNSLPDNLDLSRSINHGIFEGFEKESNNTIFERCEEEFNNTINSVPQLQKFSGNVTPSTSSTDSSVILEIDESNNNDEADTISGRRIFKVQDLFDQIAAIDHSPFNCTFKDLRFITEKRSGFESSFIFQCKICGVKEKIKNEKNQSNLNKTIVRGVVCSGSGFSHLEEICAHLDMPCMADKTFMKENVLLGDLFKDVALESMYQAGLEEKELAMKKGHVDSNGIPFITVVTDGSWGKRSYRSTNYNSLSGVACIIGFETRKVLFLGIRNSYCSVCALAINKNAEPKQHRCFKNWSGTSTAMEADGVVEGFKCSVDMHGLKYTNLIGDGDSSVTSAINEALPYGHATTIKKIECSNHLLRNYCTKLKNLTKKTENKNGSVSIILRRCLDKNILRLRKAIKGAVDYTSKINDKTLTEKVNILTEDLRNGPCHVFGDHSDCKEYFCKGPKAGEENLVPQMKECGLWYDIYTSISPLLKNAESLLMGKNNNIAEQFNAIVAKFIGGKRVNYSLRGSYESRCYAAATKHNTGSLISTLHQASGNSDELGTFSKLYEERSKKRLKRKSQSNNRKSKRVKRTTGADEYYGDIEKEADLELGEFEKRKEQFLKELDKTPTEISKIERETLGQASNSLWIKERKIRLTASMFGQVCKMRASTSCKSIIKSLLYSTFKGNDATRYGSTNEAIAIKEVELLLGIKVVPCGLFIDNEHPYLGASPDGLIGHDSILEIKCPAVAVNMTPEEAIKQKKITCCLTNENHIEKLLLKRNHNYYYQVQGQLNITKKKYCYFVIWTPKGILYEKIENDKKFWESNMINKLKEFYIECMLPEILDPRLPRKLPLRDRISKTAEQEIT